jgi:HD-GYP domain-containing protein (c-di-GMP phosphodiesterase class II)
MGGHYGYGPEERTALYLAAALHDLGKIATPAEVLEKPGKLDAPEFEIIKKHARDTYEWLSGVPDFETIRDWAAGHHEKLDGSGYPFGKAGDELDFNARLLACIDIYQAVSEPRPYHDARPHSETMPILYGMAKNKLIDPDIVRDLGEAMEEFSGRDLPPPPGAADADGSACGGD